MAALRLLLWIDYATRQIGVAVGKPIKG
ncbi:Holliday junction resolvase RuvX, partial [Pseudomonas syringae pv. tagetis]